MDCKHANIVFTKAVPFGEESPIIIAKCSSCGFFSIAQDLSKILDSILKSIERFTGNKKEYK